MDAADAAQATAAGAQTAPVRQLDAVRGPDHDVRDFAAAVDEHADLAADLAAHLGELARELVGEHTVGRQAPAEQAVEPLDLARLQPVGVPVDLDGRLPARRVPLRPHRRISPTRAVPCTRRPDRAHRKDTEHSRSVVASARLDD